MEIKERFEVTFLNDACDFIESLDEKAKIKVIYNIDKSRYLNDPKLFKKLDDEIWEFRTKYNGTQYRLLGFRFKIKRRTPLIVVSNGFIKKDQKVPKQEIIKAKGLRLNYLKL